MINERKKVLQVKNAGISFRTNNGAVKAVRNISFDLYKGETLAIVGESGSGKSVTAKAIMGILAVNSIIESGEMIYDGRDLLKINEHEFHALRGNRLSMIFQDPLSSLNPIMRIGQQMIEAMLLNNKDRRRSSKKLFNQKISQLEESIIASSQSSAQSIRTKLNLYKKMIISGVEYESRFIAAKEAIGECLSNIQDTRLALISNEIAGIQEVIADLADSAARVFNADLIPESNKSYQDSLTILKQYRKHYSADKQAVFEKLLTEMEGALKQADTIEMPNYTALTYVREKKAEVSGTTKEQSDQATDLFRHEFLSGFEEDIRKALEYSHQNSVKKQEEAIELLNQNLGYFEQDQLKQQECKRIIDTLSKAVEDSIDRLSINKDSLSYVFRSSMHGAANRYFQGIKKNPDEEKRVQKETLERERNIEKGKVAVSVVPAMLIDIQKEKSILCHTIRNLAEHFQDEAKKPVDFAKRSVEMIEYLQELSSSYAFKLTKSMAKRKAYNLLQEVGISDPRKRFRQYPFEFSGGMRQRIVIAIALSADPEILICDEPTTALDVTIQAQILELINGLKEKRNLSVVFITHDLGVVANMADRIAVMYAGKIVEYGTADDIFYDPRHPYTWALLASMPDLETKERLSSIPGTPPNMIIPPLGDAFAARNQYALQIDFEEHPPFFKLNDTHAAATWLLHPDAPKVEPPALVTERIQRMKRLEAEQNEQ